jgi:hypothetical protein
MSSEKQNPEPIWKDYVGKEVVCTLQSGIITGKMQKPDLERNCVDFLPHLVQDANLERAIFEEKIPKRVSLNLFRYDATYDILPVYAGYTQEKVEDINKKSSLRKGIGFHTN